MEPRIWPSPLYNFLRYITESQRDVAPPLEKKILDCAAGGEHPPLALFHAHGFETHGIDISDEQIKRAQAFCQAKGIDLNIRKGDMRDIPFEDASFPYVYEYYSMCHLTKADTGLAIDEMGRVLRPGGLCLLGFMSADSWPILGREEESGEFHLIEGGRQVVHSVYADDEPDRHFTELEIVQKEKVTTWFRARAARVSKEEWLQWYDEEWMSLPKAKWIEMYEERITRANYSHLFYIVR